MNATHFLIETLFGLYMMAIILRFWMQAVRVDFYNPMSQFIVKITNPPLIPLRRIIPGLWGLDLASIILVTLVAMLKVFIIALVAGIENISAIALLFTGIVTVIKESLDIIFWILIIRALLSWFSQGQSPIEMVLHQLTEPMLRPIRKLLPSMGGLDLSVLIVIISIQFLKILMMDFVGY